MSDFINNVSLHDSKYLGCELYEAMRSSTNCKITYNIGDNNYRYQFGNETVYLYSTSDILEYYFGENLDKKSVQK